MLECSVFFFTGGSYARLDFGVAGEMWREPRSIWDDYPGLGFGPLIDPATGFQVHDVLQVTDTVVKVEGVYVDLRRGCRVPPPPRARWAEPGVGVDGYMWERGSALAPGPTVLALDRVHEAWIVHVPTGTWTGSFDIPAFMDLHTSVVLPSLADRDARTVYIFNVGGDRSPDLNHIWIMDLQTGAGFEVQLAVDRFPGLAAFDGVVDCAGVAYGDFDRPARARHTREVADSFLTELAKVASVFVIEPVDLALVLEAISGLRADAFHPAGRFGLLQLTGSELESLGVDDPEQLYALTPLRQLDVVRARLELLGISAPASAAHLWAALLVPGFDGMGAKLDATVAARHGPDAELYERLAAFDPHVLGTVKLDALDAHLFQLRSGERWNELVCRLTGLAVGPLAPNPDVVEFVDWLTADAGAGRATGRLHGQGVTLTGPIGDASYLHGTFPLFDTDMFTPRLSLSDCVYLLGLDGHSYTFAFDSPVQDPVFHLASFGSTMTFDPGTVVRRVSGDATFAARDNVVTAESMGSFDGNGTVALSGVFRTITVTLTYDGGGGAGRDLLPGGRLASESGSLGCLLAVHGVSSSSHRRPLETWPLPAWSLRPIQIRVAPPGVRARCGERVTWTPVRVTSASNSHIRSPPTDGGGRSARSLPCGSTGWGVPSLSVFRRKRFDPEVPIGSGARGNQWPGTSVVTR